jgi:hypothetical protein
MPVEGGAIFRQKALRAYLKNQQKVVLPRLSSPRIFPHYWALLALLFAGSLLAWSTRVTIHASGTGLVLPRHSTASSDKLVLAALLPPAELPRLRPGQKVLARMGSAREPFSGRVVSVEPEVMSPDAIRERFAATPLACEPALAPAALAIIEVERSPGDLPLGAYAGSLPRVEVAVDARRATSFVPYLGSLL